jgi:hypothetical protein
MMREFLDILVIWFWQILEGTEASPLYMLLRCINNINIHSGMLIRPFSLFSLSLSNSRCNTQRAILLPSSFVLLQASLSLSLSLFLSPSRPITQHQGGRWRQRRQRRLCDPSDHSSARDAMLRVAGHFDALAGWLALTV